MRSSLARVGGVLAGLVVGVGLGLSAPYLFRRVMTPAALDPAAAASLEYRQFKSEIHKHFESPRGPVDWESQFKADLAAGALKTGATIVGIDCRGSQCHVALRWPSREAAIQGADRLVREPLRPNCSPKIMLPPPGAADGDADMLAKCDKS